MLGGVYQKLMLTLGMQVGKKCPKRPGENKYSRDSTALFPLFSLKGVNSTVDFRGLVVDCCQHFVLLIHTGKQSSEIRIE